MFIECRQCIWFKDCEREGRTEDRDEVLTCPHYDGLLVVAEEMLTKVPLPDWDYDIAELGYDDYEVYIEGLGFVKCNPMTLVIK